MALMEKLVLQLVIFILASIIMTIIIYVIEFLFIIYHLFYLQVFLAEHKGTNEIYAMKSLRKDLVVLDDDIECTLTERNILAHKNKSPFIISAHSCFQTRNHLFIVMEYAQGGDLMFHMINFGRFPENQSW